MRLQYRVTAIVFAVLLVLGAGGLSALVYFQQKSDIAQFEASGLATARTIEHFLHASMLIKNRNLIQHAVEEATSEGSNIRKLQIVSRSGKVTASSDISEIGKAEEKHPEIVSIMEAGETVRKYYSTGIETDLYIVHPIPNDPECQTCHEPSQQVLGAISMHIDLSSLDIKQRQMIMILVTVGGLTFASIGMVIAFALRRAVVKPVEERIVEAEEELDKQQKLYLTGRLSTIGEMVSGIAHELNNPLTSVIGFSDLLLERDLPDDVKEDLKTINKEAQRTAQIVRNLLTFARKHPQEKQLVNINEAILGALELRAYEQKLNDIQVITHLDPDLPEITANPFQLQQVFVNIIVNAEYFMIEAHRGGTLTITTERVGNIIRLFLADDGPGIPRENLSRIFDPFFTTKEVGKGTGLGLSICHGVVTEHGGRIYAESEPGKGATFIIELPISPPAKSGVIKES